jgi:hypothetical protein
MTVHIERDKRQVVMADRFLLKRALDQWRNSIAVQKDAQENGANLLQGVWLKLILKEWKCYASCQVELR